MLLLTQFHTLPALAPPPRSSPTSHTKEPETLFTAILSKCAHYFIHACEARAGIPVQYIRKLGHPDCSSYPGKGTGEDWGWGAYPAGCWLGHAALSLGGHHIDMCYPSCLKVRVPALYGRPLLGQGFVWSCFHLGHDVQCFYYPQQFCGTFRMHVLLKMRKMQEAS